MTTTALPWWPSAITKLLDSNGIHATSTDEGSIQFGLSGKNRAYQYVCYLRAERSTVSVNVVGLWFLEGLDADPRPAETCNALELLLHLNFRSWLGHFEVDSNDGEVRYRVELSFKEELEESQLLVALVACGTTVDQSAGVVGKVLAGKLTASEAVAKIDQMSTGA